MFRQPMEKRKKAETSENSSTWCERTAAPRLWVGGSAMKAGAWERTKGADVQALDDAERAEAELVPEDGEEAGEEGGGPADLGHDEDDDLEDDQETVEDGPEGTRGLVGDRASAVKGCVSNALCADVEG